MTMKAYSWPGLKNPVYLPDWIVVEVKIIPKMTRWTSGIPSSQHISTTWHDSGNPDTGAGGEYNWARNNRPGGVAASYNGVYDGRKLIITQRFDELVGHAANHVGNMTSYAFEQAFGAVGGGYEASLKVGAAIHGGIIASRGWATATGLKQHNFWSGKDCPGQIRNKGNWTRVVAMVEAARIAAVNAAGARPEPAGPIYAKPIHIKELEYSTFPPALVNHDGGDFVYVRDMVEAVKATPRLQQAYDGAERTGPDIKAGERFPVDWLFKSDDGQWYYMSPWATRIRLADTKRVSDEVPA
jgi:hypothetical protein